LTKAIEIAHELRIPSPFVETNCSWSRTDEVTREKLRLLKDKGLRGILISVNPYYAEYGPLDPIERCIRTGTTTLTITGIVCRDIVVEFFQFSPAEPVDYLSFSKKKIEMSTLNWCGKNTLGNSGDLMKHDESSSWLSNKLVTAQVDRL
jgi:hypothetical protein